MSSRILQFKQMSHQSATTSAKAYPQAMDDPIHLSLSKGDHIYLAGSRIRFPYLVIAGDFKSYVIDEEGDECVTGFHMPGDILGLEALVGQKTLCSVIALDFAQVTAFRTTGLKNTTGGASMLMSMHREIARLMQLLQQDRSSPEARVARFLLEYGQTQAGRGYSQTDIRLPMGRADLASHLGLAKETVSRVLARFRRRGWLYVDNSHIVIRDADHLADTAGLTRTLAKQSRGLDTINTQNIPSLTTEQSR